MSDQPYERIEIDTDLDLSEISLVDLVEWANGVLNTIPDEHKESATLSVDSENGFWCHLCWIRPFSVQEIAERNAKAAAERARQVAEYINLAEARDLSEYARLIRKYGVRPFCDETGVGNE